VDKLFDSFLLQAYTFIMKRNMSREAGSASGGKFLHQNPIVNTHAFSFKSVLWIGH